jgi:hypothetical protein
VYVEGHGYAAVHVELIERTLKFVMYVVEPGAATRALMFDSVDLYICRHSCAAMVK